MTDSGGGFVFGGCNRGVFSAYEDGRLFYAAHNMLLVHGNTTEAVVPPFSSRITALSVDGDRVALGSAEGDIALLVGREVIVSAKAASSVSSVGIVGDILLSASRDLVQTWRIPRDPGASNLEKSEYRVPGEMVISVCGVEVEEKTVIVAGTYGGTVVVLAPGPGTRKLQFKSPIRTVDAFVERDEEEREFALICGAIQDGRAFVLKYSPGNLRRTGMISLYRGRCMSARWTAEREIITSSDDGTVSKWVESNGWQSSQMFGEMGGPCVQNAMGTEEGVILQMETGGFYRYGREGYLERFVGGSTEAIVSIDQLEDLVLVACLDRSVRIYQARREGVVEIYRPLIAGYEMVSALFLDLFTLVTAAQENVLRILRGTEGYRFLLEEGRGKRVECDKDLCVLAGMQELSLSNIATEPESGKEKAFSTLGTERALSSEVFQEIHKEYGHPFEVESLCVIKGKMILSANRASTCTHAKLVVSNMRYEVVQRIESHSQSITSICAAVDGTLVSSVGRDRRCTLYQAVSREAASEEITGEFKEGDCGLRMVCSVRDHKKMPTGSVFSRDSTHLSTCGRDGNVFRYRIQENGLKMVMNKGFGEEISSIEEYEDVLFLGSVSGDIHLVSMSSGDVRSLRIHNSRVNRLKVSRLREKPFLISASHVLQITPLSFLPQRR
jgi:WD40 repeat protein